MYSDCDHLSPPPLVWWEAWIVVNSLLTQPPASSLVRLSRGSIVLTGCINPIMHMWASCHCFAEDSYRACLTLTEKNACPFGQLRGPSWYATSSLQCTHWAHFLRLSLARPPRGSCSTSLLATIEKNRYIIILEQNCSSPALLTIWAGLFFVVGGCSVYPRPLLTRCQRQPLPHIATTGNIPRHCQMSLEGQSSF